MATPLLVGARDLLAETDFDSLLDDNAVLMRSNADNQRSASFSRDGLTLDFEILDDGRTLVGQILPAEKGRIRLVQFNGDQDLWTDPLGRFRGVIARGPVQLRVESGDAELSTPWLTR